MSDIIIGSRWRHRYPKDGGKLLVEVRDVNPTTKWVTYLEVFEGEEPRGPVDFDSEDDFRSTYRPA
jgi:hypothetical protein